MIVKCRKNQIYLEVGVYRGCIIIELSEINKKIKCIGIDNFDINIKSIYDNPQY